MPHALPITLLLLLPLAGIARGEGYCIVVAQGSPVGELKEATVRDVFLKKRGFDSGTRLVPVNVIGNEPVRLAFESKVLKLDRDGLKRYWTANHFQGVSPPTTQPSLQSLKSFIAKVDGAIGYLPRSMVDDSLKVVYEF